MKAKFVLVMDATEDSENIPKVKFALCLDRRDLSCGLVFFHVLLCGEIGLLVGGCGACVVFVFEGKGLFVRDDNVFVLGHEAVVMK